MRLLVRVIRVLGMLLAVTLLGGCPTSRYVVMTMALGPSQPAGKCYEICTQAFGVRPTVNCGPLNGGGVLCTYIERAPKLPTRTLDARECQEACSRAGVPDAESCEALISLTGEPVVACAYRVGYH